jgi:uncharacterized membrane protein YfcA
MFALVLIAVVAGALAQRLAGLGFGLLVSPVLVVLLGPFDGVMIINLCGAVSSLLILSRVWRFVDWQRYFRLALAAVAGVLPGAWLASNVPEAPLEICIGVLLFIALLVSQRLTRSSWHARGPVPLVSLGFSSGQPPPWPRELWNWPLPECSGPVLSAPLHADQPLPPGAGYLTNAATQNRPPRIHRLHRHPGD